LPESKSLAKRKICTMPFLSGSPKMAAPVGDAWNFSFCVGFQCVLCREALDYANQVHT